MPPPTARSQPKRRGRHASWRRCACLAHLSLASLGLAIWRWAAFALPGDGLLQREGGQVAPAAGCRARQEQVGRKASSARSSRGARLDSGPRRAAGEADGGAAASPGPLKSRLRVKALNKKGSAWLLEMGGQRVLVNPNLEDNLDMPPEKVHELVDYVVITSSKEEAYHSPTIGRMNLAKTNFIACAPVGEILSQLMARNLAVLAPGPGGRVLLEGEEGTAPIAMMVTPGAPALPWETPEVGFVFVNLETGVAVGYEAFGQFLGPGASSEREGIPEEAYQVDYLVTADLRETGAVVKGLTAKGAELRGVVALPSRNSGAVAAAESNPVLGVLLAQDRFVGKVLGETNTPDEFRSMLSQDTSLAKTRLYESTVGGDPVELE